jgi:hypothetical protein
MDKMYNRISSGSSGPLQTVVNKVTSLWFGPLVDYLSDYWILKKPSTPWFIMSETVASRGLPLDHPVTKLRSIKQQVPCTSPIGYIRAPAVVKMQNSSKFRKFILRYVTSFWVHGKEVRKVALKYCKSWSIVCVSAFTTNRDT